jgi:hypothetical protein
MDINPGGISDIEEIVPETHNIQYTTPTNHPPRTKKIKLVHRSKHANMQTTYIFAKFAAMLLVHLSWYRLTPGVDLYVILLNNNQSVA